ncbi:MAG: acyl-CoA dehydrogenase family protein, partial [Desulfobacter sp.]|uniref:acyl-CoA dehydrogenase family protein n=1 Tax=Desulfobacter sp. TaxID=2294 RepID=UPI001B6032C6
MASYISWKEINDHRYFAWGLQPQEEFTKKPIPCPDYCHKYHLLFKRIAEIEQKKGFPENCSKQKEEYFALWAQLSDITRKDPEAISWKFFQMPEVQSNIDKLQDLLAGAVFNKAALDEIRQRIPTPSVFFPDLNIDRLKYYAGRWAGVMCLTEAHAGTDLGLIRTRATENSDGSYKITGSKIFITGGEQDLTENIIHLVLAKLPNAPEGARGISLFLVPKINVNADGSLGSANAVTCGSIEHKMGIKASATCVMNFDDAKGYLVGEPNKGLAAMFTMMNYERLSIGIQGIGCAET